MSIDSHVHVLLGFFDGLVLWTARSVLLLRASRIARPRAAVAATLVFDLDRLHARFPQRGNSRTERFASRPQEGVDLARVQLTDDIDLEHHTHFRFHLLPLFTLHAAVDLAS